MLIYSLEDFYKIKETQYNDQIFCIFINKDYFSNEEKFCTIILPTYKDLYSSIPHKKVSEINDTYDIREFFDTNPIEKIKIISNSEKIINNRYQNYAQELFSIINSKKKENKTDLLQQVIIKIVKAATQDEESKDNNSYPLFLKSLTKLEKRALNTLLHNGYLNEYGEGNVSITKLCADSEVSRPVFKNIFTKLKDYNIASIQNKGVNGTEIKILSQSLLKEKLI